MESDFTLFWKAYLEYRDKYHDAAWEDILTRTLLALPINQRQQFVDILIEKRIENASEYSDWAFESFQKYADRKQIDKLENLAKNYIQNEISFEKFADLIVFFIKINFQFIAEEVQRILRIEPFNPMYKWILKNTFYAGRNIFMSAFKRYLNHSKELGYDIGTFIKYHHDVYKFLCENIDDFKRFDDELKKY